MPPAASTTRPEGALALLGLLLLGIAGCTSAKESVRVVLITLDTLRYDALLATGEVEGSAQMPLTSAWLEKGAVFTRFYSASSSTQPTHASIFTGRHPWEHGVHANAVRFETDEPSIVEILRDAGFSTGAVVASFPVGSVVRFDRGFDTFVEPFTERFGPGAWTAVGAKGIGEPLMGCAASALICAISDALGGHYFNRTPVVPDMIINATSGRPQSHKPLQVNTD